MARFFRVRRPPVTGANGKQDADKHENNRRGRVAKTAKAIVWGARSGNVVGSAFVGYELHTVSGPILAFISPSYQLAKVAHDMYNSLFSGDQQQAIKNLDSILREGSLRQSDHATARTYLDNFMTYRLAATTFDRGKENAVAAVVKGSEAAKRITQQAPTAEYTKPFEDVHRGLHDWLLNTFGGAKADDPKYIDNFVNLNRLKVDAYDTLQSTSSKVTEEIAKPKPNLGYVVKEMQTFNKAYELLKKEDEVARVGVEKVDTAQLKTMQQQIDSIKPSQGWITFDVVFPTLAAGALCYIVHRKLVRPFTKAVYLASGIYKS